MQSEGDGQLAVTTYARLSTLEHPDASDLTDYWEDPVSHFLTQVRQHASLTIHNGTSWIIPGRPS